MGIAIIGVPAFVPWFCRSIASFKGWSAGPEQQERDVASAWSVELDQKHPLPSSELELAVDDVQGGRWPEQQRAAMGMTVRWLAEHAVDRAQRDVVVTVNSICRRHSFQQLGHVRQEQRLVLIDDDSDRRVQRLDVQQPRPDAGLRHERLKIGSKVDELRGVFGLDAEPRVARDRIRGSGVHGNPPRGGSASGARQVLSGK
jgi:hypothetical protein